MWSTLRHRTLADGALWTTLRHPDAIAVFAFVAAAIAASRASSASVYEVNIDDDHATALVYHTSHQVFTHDPDTVCVLVARYHNELTRTPDGWRISRLLFELLWGDQRQDSTAYLASVGGRGPVITPE